MTCLKSFPNSPTENQTLKYMQRPCLFEVKIMQQEALLCFFFVYELEGKGVVIVDVHAHGTDSEGGRMMRSFGDSRWAEPLGTDHTFL